MIYFLKFDPLFVILTSLIWMIPPIFNFTFLLSPDSYILNIATNHIWFLWTLAFIQLVFIVIDWQFQQGDFTKYMGIPVDITSVFIACFEIFNYAMQGWLLLGYAYMVRHDNQINGLF